METTKGKIVPCKPCKGKGYVEANGRKGTCYFCKGKGKRIKKVVAYEPIGEDNG